MRDVDDFGAVGDGGVIPEFLMVKAFFVVVFKDFRVEHELLRFVRFAVDDFEGTEILRVLARFR